MGPNGGGTDELGDKATQVIRNLTPQDAITRLDAVRAYAIKLPAASGKSASIGFLLGRFDQFQLRGCAARAERGRGLLRHVAVGSAVYTNIKAPVLGLYGGRRTTASNRQTVPTAEAENEEAGEDVRARTCSRARGTASCVNRHSPLRGNMKATEQAWPLTIAFLKEYTS